MRHFARQAIQTTYISATNTKHARLQVKRQGKSTLIPWNNELDQDANHRRGAQLIAKELGWKLTAQYGVLPNGSYCHPTR